MKKIQEQGVQSCVFLNVVKMKEESAWMRGNGITKENIG